VTPAPRLPYTFGGLTTERLLVRPMTAADVGDLHVYQSRADVCRYLPFEPRTREEVAAKVAQFSKALTLAGDGDYWQLAIERRDEPGRVFADLYFTISSTANAAGEIGWTQHPDAGGRGYMTEAAGALLDVAFGELDLHRVAARLDARNDASAALCRRLAMREEARLREDEWFKGEWSTTVLYAVLDREWAAWERPQPRR
jgi:RimJ/RimL family protein N-acetyltransferase